ncbi:MAG: MerR family transcriptional regulator [Gammaproteobacteria bacterium]
MSTTPPMTIGQLAQAAQVNVETIRYYQRLGLLAAPQRPYGSIRRYGDAELERIQFIKRAQRLGFTLAEIALLFTLDATRDRQQAHHLAVRKIEEIDQRVADLRAMRAALRQLVEACEAGDANLPCPIVEAFRGDGGQPLGRSRH